MLIRNCWCPHPGKKGGPREERKEKEERKRKKKEKRKKREGFIVLLIVLSYQIIVLLISDYRMTTISLNDRLISTDDLGSFNDIEEEEISNQRSNHLMDNFTKTMKAEIITKGQRVSVIYDPTVEVLQTFSPGDQPSVMDYYIKRIYRYIPHLNFPRQADQILCNECRKNVSKKGWSRSDRLIFDLHGTIHLLLYQYTCTNKNCIQHSQEMHCLHKREDGKYKLYIPEAIREIYYSDITLTHRSGHTSSFLQYIVDDTMTSKSFYSIGEGLRSFRVQEYLKKKRMYTLLLETFIEKKTGQCCYERGYSKTKV